MRCDGSRVWGKNAPSPCLHLLTPHPFIMLTRVGEGGPYRGSYKALVVFPNVH